LQITKKQDFLKGAAILAAASIFVKIVGAIYKIPIFNILDDTGIGFFQVTYNVYTLILTIATYGIPVALSRMVSSASASGDNALVKRYFSVALPAFTIIGVAAMAVMFFFSDFFAGLMNNPPASYGIRVLAPAVLFVCVISVFRGYMQGFQNMIPTAASQIVEVVCKAAFGIVAALWLTSMNYGPYIVSAGALTGVTVGLGLCIPLLFWYKRKYDRAAPQISESSGLPSRANILGTLMKVSLPITIGASFMTIMVVIDTSIVLGRLQWILGTMNDELILKLSELPLIDFGRIIDSLQSADLSILSIAEPTHIDYSRFISGLSSADLDSLITKLSSADFGIYARGLTIYNLPSALIVPVSVSVVPAIAAALGKLKGSKDSAANVSTETGTETSTDTNADTSTDTSKIASKNAVYTSKALPEAVSHAKTGSEANRSEAGGIMQSAVKLVTLLAMPAAVGIMVLANPILVALYNDSRQITTTVLIILGASSFFVCFQLINTAILQANGHERLAMMAFPVGAAIKIALGYILVGNPAIGIIGSPIGTLACFVTLAILNIIFIIVKIKDRPKYIKVLLKPLLCSSLMAVCAFFSYRILLLLGSGLLGEGRMAVTVYLAGAILLSVALYGVLVIVTRTVTMEDMKLVPKGEKIGKLLRIK